MVRNWRKPPRIPPPKYRQGYRDITLYSVNHGERERFFPFLEDGTLDPEIGPKMMQLCRDKDSDAMREMDPRLIKLLYKIVVRFKARQINIISGYREQAESPKESNHTRGKAIDFMVPGVSLGAVAKYARTFGHVGVGFYPVSGFIHLDVRGEGPSYFWVDRSGPGRGSCMRHIQSKTARKSDRKWRPENDEPKPEKNRKGELKNSGA